MRAGLRLSRRLPPAGTAATAGAATAPLPECSRPAALQLHMLNTCSSIYLKFLPTPPTSSMPAVQDGAGLLPAYRGTLDALRQIAAQEGWRALYSGGWASGRLGRRVVGGCSGMHAGNATWQLRVAALLLHLLLQLLPPLPELFRHGCWGQAATAIPTARPSCPPPCLRTGLTPALAGSGMAWGIYFYAYNRAKQRYQRLQRAGNSSGRAGSSGTSGQQGQQQQQRLGPGMHLISAAEAGTVVSAAALPQLQKGQCASH